MARYYDYSLPKNDILFLCKNILQNLDYEIDIYAPESNVITTKPTRLRQTLRRYDYILYLQVTDKIEIFISAERSIFNRGSESNIGQDDIIAKQTDDNLPLVLQNKIFKPIAKKMRLRNFYEIVQNK